MTTVVMPQLGESVVEGTVVRWLVKPGQKVARDESLLEVATDKANSEIPAPNAGVVTQLLAAEGAVVPVGGALCTLDESGAGASAPAAPAPKAAAAPSAPVAAAPIAAAPVAPAALAAAQGDFDASPVARNVAQEHGVDL
ncbi:MAG: hypothetical protein JST92_09680, partial [Deltaproteobacteria bacterium]|nr:hypothetical protein [Deltaproteobacteria bacterium]